MLSFHKKTLIIYIEINMAKEKEYIYSVHVCYLTARNYEVG